MRVGYLAAGLDLDVAIGMYQKQAGSGIDLRLAGLDVLARALGTARMAPRSWLRLLAGMLGAGLLYALVARLAMVGQVANERTGFATPERLLEKMLDHGVYLAPSGYEVVFPSTQLTADVLARVRDAAAAAAGAIA